MSDMTSDLGIAERVASLRSQRIGSTPGKSPSHYLQFRPRITINSPPKAPPEVSVRKGHTSPAPSLQPGPSIVPGKMHPSVQEDLSFDISQAGTPSKDSKRGLRVTVRELSKRMGHRLRGGSASRGTRPHANEVPKLWEPASPHEILAMMLCCFACHHGPSVVVLEDLHFADPASWQIIEAAARIQFDTQTSPIKQPIPLVIVATARPMEESVLFGQLHTSAVAAKSSCLAARKAVAGLPSTVSLKLDKLQHEETAQLVRAVLGSDPASETRPQPGQGPAEQSFTSPAPRFDSEMIRCIHNRSEGQPYYIQETVEWLKRQVAVRMTQEGSSSMHDSSYLRTSNGLMRWLLTKVPMSQQIVESIDFLKPRQQMTLRLAAVLGHASPISAFLLAAIHPTSATVGEVLADLEALTQERLLLPHYLRGEQAALAAPAAVLQARTSRLQQAYWETAPELPLFSPIHEMHSEHFSDAPYYDGEARSESAASLRAGSVKATTLLHLGEPNKWISAHPCIYHWHAFCEDESSRKVQEAVSSLQGTGAAASFSIEEAAASVTYTFTSSLLRDAVLAMIPFGFRRDLHARIAVVLEQLLGLQQNHDGADVMASTVAYHWDCSCEFVATSHPKRAVTAMTWWDTAAHEAAAHSAFNEAIYMFAKAAALADSLGTQATTESLGLALGSDPTHLLQQSRASWAAESAACFVALDNGQNAEVHALRSLKYDYAIQAFISWRLTLQPSVALAPLLLRRAALRCKQFFHLSWTRGFQKLCSSSRDLQSARHHRCKFSVPQYIHGTEYRPKQSRQLCDICSGCSSFREQDIHAKCVHPSVTALSVLTQVAISGGANNTPRESIRGRLRQILDLTLQLQEEIKLDARSTAALATVEKTAWRRLRHTHADKASSK
eukprot:scaffold39039_cov38-Prasinocladus_malaysianus.AAC.3